MFCAARSQAREILRSIEDRLATIGSDKRQIAHITIWLADVSYFAEVTAVWNEWVDPQNPPCRACVRADLARPEVLVEIMVTAAK